MWSPEGRLPRLLSSTVKTFVGVVVQPEDWSAFILDLLSVFKINLKKMEIKMSCRAQQHDRLNICQNVTFEQTKLQTNFNL